jgi:hypothetical protein
MASGSERVQCLICGSDSIPEKVQYRNEGRHKHRIFDGLSILVCGACQCSWVEKPPTNRDLADYYTHDYIPARMQHVETDSWPIWDGRPASLITLSRLFTEFSPGDLFIDIGPGNGAALSLAPYLLPRPKIGCVEFNVKSIRFFERHCPSVIIRDSVESFVTEHGPGSAKMIYSAHCVEHFRGDDLTRELHGLHRALSREGVLAVEVPFGGIARMKASNHSPHLIFFSPDGLSCLLRRIGFDVKLCFTAIGRTRQGENYVNRLFPVPSAGDTDATFAARISALNVADFIGKIPRNAEGGVVKCIATKRPGT